MARSKTAPFKREVSDSWIEKHGSPIREAISLSHEAGQFPPQNGHAHHGDLVQSPTSLTAEPQESAAGIRELIICAGGIYASL